MSERTIRATPFFATFIGLSAALAVGKLTGLIDWSWFFVLLPAMFITFTYIFFAAILVLVYWFSKR